MNKIIIDEYEKTWKDCGKVKNPTHVFVQNPREAQSLIDLVVKQCQGQETINYVEIGARLGGSFMFWGRTLKHFFPKVYGIAVDLPGAPHEGNHQEKLENCIKTIGATFDYNVIINDSHSIDTQEQIDKLLNNNKIDFLFIDGDHSKKGVIEDCMMYSYLVKRPGGVMAFHDIVQSKCWPWVEVWQAWPEIKAFYKDKTIQEFKYEGDKYGIGAIIL